MSEAKPDLQILKKVKEKRGYILPYHELFFFVDPGLLDAYDHFYENLTLVNRHLDNKTKELIWFAILIGVQEKAGTLHIKRGIKAGIGDREFSEVLALCQVAMGLEAISFIEDNWQEHLPGVGPWTIYQDLLEKVTREMVISPRAIELIFIGIYTALPRLQKAALRLHLKRAKDHGVKDVEICEAMSYVFIPRGANALIEASAVLQRAVQEGDIVPDSSLSHWQDQADI